MGGGAYKGRGDDADTHRHRGGEEAHAGGVKDKCPTPTCHLRTGTPRRHFARPTTSMPAVTSARGTATERASATYHAVKSAGLIRFIGALSSMGGWGEVHNTLYI